MFIDVRAKATVQLPKEVAKALKISTGDQLKVEVVDGVIHLTPVVIATKAEVRKLREEIARLKKQAGDNQEAFTGVDAALDEMTTTRKK